MAVLKKFFKDIKNEHILGIVGLVVLLFALYKYSSNKNMFMLGMTHGPSTLNSSNVNNTSSTQPVVGASTSSMSNFNSVSETTPENSLTNDVVNKPAINPSELLPSTSNAWAESNPSTELNGVNLLNPTQLVGINTQGSSLRNANLQLRSEPANPRMNTNSPWNQSTIESDTMRRPLDIGTSA